MSHSIYSFAVYFGSSIYSPALGDVMEELRVGSVAGTLGLALYVLACMFSTLFYYESTIRFAIMIGF